MKKQIFTIIILLMGGISTFGQFKLDGGTNSLRLQTGGIDRLFINPGTAANAGNIGINTLSTNAKFTINGDMSFKNLTRFTVNGGYTATNRSGASVLIFEAGGVLNGIAGGVDGMLLYVLCGYKMPSTLTTGALIIKHEESVSETVPANRIMTHTEADFNISNGIGGVMMVYDGGRQRWRIMEVTSGASSFSGWGLAGNSGTTPATDFIGSTDAQPLAFKTNNVERLRILSNGNFGIGTSLPATNVKFHLNNGSSGVTPSSSGTFSPTLFMERNANNYLEIASPDANERGITFSNPTDGNSGGIYYLNKDMYFNTNSNNRRMTILANGNVGIGTNIPTAKLDIEGDIVVRKTTISTSGVQNALNRGGGSSIYFNVTGTVTVNGIAGGQDGMLLYLFTAAAATLILNNENAGATTFNRIATNNGGPVTISGRGGATLIYDSGTNLWRVIGVAN